MLTTKAAVGGLAALSLAASAPGDPGDILWRFDVPGHNTINLHRPTVAADGTIYWSLTSLYAITPSGQQLWSRPRASTNPVGIGQDGTLYVGGWREPPNAHLPALKAFTPAGDHLWDFHDFGTVLGFLGGPNVGPDGNVYAVMYGGMLTNPTGFGAFSLTPAGSLRWHVDGFENDAGVPSSEIVFGNGHAYKAEYNAPMPPQQLQSGLIALELDGDIAWRQSIGTQPVGPSRHPQVSPLNGNIHLMRQPRTLQTFTPAGTLAWYYTGPFTPTGFGQPAVGPDGSVYIINGDQHVIALDAAGNIRWTAQGVVPYFASAPEISPDGRLLVFGTRVCNGGACPSRVMGLDTTDGSVVFDRALPNVPSGMPSVAAQPRFSPDGSVVYVGADAFSSGSTSHLFAIQVSAGSAPCYANCDQSSVEPVLNVDDFTCFINMFAQAQSLPHQQQVEHYANCDASTIMPALNVDDFTCFINQFAQGCP